MTDQAERVLKEEAESGVGPWGGIYEHLAGAYDFVMASSGWHRMLDRYALEGLEPGSLLDVGCGTGRLMKQAVDKGFEVYGIDPAPAMVEEACQSTGLGQDRVRIASAASLPFDDGRFDVVIECGALIHVPDITAAAREMVRVTRPGGVIRIFDYAAPSSDGPYTRFVGLWARAMDYQVHDFRTAFEPAAACEAHQSIGRGGYLQRFDFRKPRG
jgi:ubiquinone/menaquinone biosynthesis C-methylase UbiE